MRVATVSAATADQQKLFIRQQVTGGLVFKVYK
jgi:hypothetical protein